MRSEKSINWKINEIYIYVHVLLTCFAGIAIKKLFSIIIFFLMISCKNKTRINIKQLRKINPKLKLIDNKLVYEHLHAIIHSLKYHQSL